jgi:hypothetical protein
MRPCPSNPRPRKVIHDREIDSLVITPRAVLPRIPGLVGHAEDSVADLWLERGVVLEVFAEFGMVGNRAGNDLPQDPIVLVDQPSCRG